MRQFVPLMVVVAGSCGGGGARQSNHAPPAIAAVKPEVASFRAVADTPVVADDPAVLLSEALAGTASASSDELGSRLQVRTLKIPSPPRGSTAKFNLAGHRRGWVTALPTAELLPTAAFEHGRIFLSGGFASRRFFAFDAYSGEAQWALTAEDGGPSAAVVRDDVVAFNAESCKIFVAEAATGKLKWAKWLGDPLMSVPVISGDVVMTAYPAGGSHVFTALALKDGEARWTVPVPNDVIRVPQVVGGAVYFATMDGTAFKIDVKSGKVAWQRDVKATSAPWVADGRVYLTRKLGSGDKAVEQLVALAAASGKIVVEGDRFPAPYLAGTSRDRELIHSQAGAWGTVRDAEHLGLRNVAAGWAFQGSSPVVVDGRVYLAVGGEIRASDAASGKVLWKRTYKQAAGAQAVTPPAVVGAQLVFGTVDGHVYFADVDTGLISAAYDVGEAVISQPIVAQGWVYVTTGQGKLVGLELADPMWDGWHMWGGNPEHTGLVGGAGSVDPALLASLARPGQGTMRNADGKAAEELPLLESRVAVDISGFAARVSVTQRFKNPGDKAIEATYMFPLPDDAAVDAMEMRIGTRVVRAEIKQKAEAKKTYDAARASGKKAALLEQQRPDLFAQRVANLGAGETIDVEIEYVQRLPYRDGAWELRYPLVAAPRAGEPVSTVRADAVELAVNVEAGLPIVAIESPSHPVDVDLRGASASVKLAGGQALANRDFVLRVATAGEAPTATLLADGGYFSLLVQPPAAPVAAQIGDREIVLAVDRSSSMRGRAMAQARAVAEATLAGLRTGDRFNVVWMDGGAAVSLAPEPLAPTPANLEKARAALAGLEAAGADGMLPAIEQALSAPAAGPGWSGAPRTRIVALISDGYFADEAVALKAIAPRVGGNRIHAVGIGAAVNRLLLERAAELGRGRLTVAPLSEEPAAIARRFAAGIDRPVFTDLQIDWGGLEVADVYPRRLPDLFAGEPLVVHGRYTKAGTGTIAVRGSVAGKRHQRDVEVALPEGAGGETAHRSQRSLWARAAVHDRMNRLILRDDDALIGEVTRLGLQHRLVTQWTSFVAVDHGDTPPATGAARPAPGGAATPADPAKPADADEPAAEAAASKPTVTPAMALPGDPEIRIPAPRDARAVTVVLPFGETTAAFYQAELGLWVARFLIPSDATDGAYPIEILITGADGAQQRKRAWYEVDSSAPLVELEVVGAARPGATVTLRARQRLTAADLARLGAAGAGEITDGQVQILSDARRVSARIGDEVVTFDVAGPGLWEATYTVPADARGRLAVSVVVVDLAANVRTQALGIEVVR